MDLGLPSKEQMRDYLISKGMDPALAERQAGAAEASNLRSALTTLGILGGGAATRASEAAPIFNSARNYLMQRFRPAAADAKLMEPAAGQAARTAISEGKLLTPVTSAATVGAATAPIVMGNRDLTMAALDRTRAQTQGGDYNDSFNASYTAPPSEITPADLYDMRDAPQGIPHPPPPPRPAYLGPQVQARAPAPAASRPAAAPAAAPAQGGDMMSRLFSGPDMQSARGSVVQRTAGPMAQGQERPAARLNWGDSDSAADFFRADQARQGMEKSGETFTGLKHGGAAQAPGKDAALHKALEIIHHMITRGH